MVEFKQNKVYLSYFTSRYIIQKYLLLNITVLALRKYSSIHSKFLI